MKYYLVPEEGNPTNLVKIGTSGFVPAGGVLIPDEFMNEDQENLFIEIVADERGNDVKNVLVDTKKRSERHIEKEAMRGAEETAEVARKAKRKERKDRLGAVDFSKIDTVKELKQVVKDLLDSLEDK
jgi:hypothetical protein